MELFGKDPSELLNGNSELMKLRTILLMMLAGLLVFAGCIQVSIAWFGLRCGQKWALTTLAIAGLIQFPFWYLVLKPYIKASIHLGLSDIPPFIWLPSVLLLPAIILGWIGLNHNQ